MFEAAQLYEVALRAAPLHVESLGNVTTFASGVEYELSHCNRVAGVEFVSSSEEGEVRHSHHLLGHPEDIRLVDHLEEDGHTAAVAEEVDHSPAEDHHNLVVEEADRNLVAARHSPVEGLRSPVEVDHRILAEAHRSPAVVVAHCPSHLWRRRMSRYYRAKA